MSESVTNDFTSVELIDASRHFGRRRALAKTRLTFRAGEIAGLLGPNGAGKSTLLGIISTLILPTSGDVHFGGQPARARGDALRGAIGMLGHDLYLYGDLTARENLTFFGQLYSVPNLDARVQDALAAARLTDRADDRVGNFSRGLRQRLALERALLNQPRIILLDEPFTGLDDESSVLLAARLRQIANTGAIVIMATHEFEHSEGVLDRVICLRDGRTREVPAGAGTLRERYRRALAESWS